MKYLFYVCNALDDNTRLERGIVTDSPAASRKIFHICQALRKADVRSLVISMGRGRQDGSGRYFRSCVRRVNGVPILYLPFLNLPFFSELLTLFSFVPVIWRMRSVKGEKAVLFYNRMPAYLLGLLMARVLRFITLLDLEDGETNSNAGLLVRTKLKIISWFFDSLCSGGALLACSALKRMTRLSPTHCFYGAYEIHAPLSNPVPFPIVVLFGGTVSVETGAQLLVDAIKILRKESPSWAKKIRFEITGKGNCITQFKALAEDVNEPHIVVHGRTTDDGYREILVRTQIGLALKPNSGVLADTTFPSKVIEFASHRILVITTDISDVRKVLNVGAVYLSKDDPQVLIEKLHWVVENRDKAKNLALKGERAVASLCASEVVGQRLSEFIFDIKKESDK